MTTLVLSPWQHRQLHPILLRWRRAAALAAGTYGRGD